MVPVWPALNWNTEPGYPFMRASAAAANQPIADVFSQIGKKLQSWKNISPILKPPGFNEGGIRIFWASCYWVTEVRHPGKEQWEFCHPLSKRHPFRQETWRWQGILTWQIPRSFWTGKYWSGEFQRQSDPAAMMEVLHFYCADELFAIDIVKVLKKSRATVWRRV